MCGDLPKCCQINSGPLGVSFSVCGVSGHAGCGVSLEIRSMPWALCLRDFPVGGGCS